MSESRTPEIPEPPTDTISGIETVHLDLEGLSGNTEADPGTPLNLENLELQAAFLKSYNIC